MFSSKFCKISKNTFLTEHLRRLFLSVFFKYTFCFYPDIPVLEVTEWKVSKDGDFSGPCFTVFWLNTEKYCLELIKNFLEDCFKDIFPKLPYIFTGMTNGRKLRFVYFVQIKKFPLLQSTVVPVATNNTTWPDPLIMTCNQPYQTSMMELFC